MLRSSAPTEEAAHAGALRALDLPVVVSRREGEAMRPAISPAGLVFFDPTSAAAMPLAAEAIDRALLRA